MSTRSLGVSESVQRYLLEVASEPELLTRLREETQALPEGRMQISPEQGRFMAWLVRCMGARRCLEIGVFTGYSSLSVALALPADGVVVALDVSDEYTRVARRYWALAGVEHKVDLRLAPARVSLAALRDDGHAGSFDFAFIDADKQSYGAYYDAAVDLVRPGGVVAIDNMLWGGRVADVRDTEAETVSIRALNAKAAADPRVQACLLPVGDGLLLVQKL